MHCRKGITNTVPKDGSKLVDFYTSPVVTASESNIHPYIQWILSYIVQKDNQNIGVTKAYDYILWVFGMLRNVMKVPDNTCVCLFVFTCQIAYFNATNFFLVWREPVTFVFKPKIDRTVLQNGAIHFSPTILTGKPKMRSSMTLIAMLSEIPLVFSDLEQTQFIHQQLCYAILNVSHTKSTREDKPDNREIDWCVCRNFDEHHERFNRLIYKY